MYLSDEIWNNNQIEQIIATLYRNLSAILFSGKIHKTIRYSTTSSLLKLKMGAMSDTSSLEF